MHELKPGRRIESEQGILVEQVCVLVKAAGENLLDVSIQNLKHLQPVFESLPPGRLLTEVVAPALPSLQEMREMAVFFLQMFGLGLIIIQFQILADYCRCSVFV